MIRPDYHKEQFPHWCSIPVRYRDLDTLNHVNNAIFSTYYEEARIRFLREVPKLQEQLMQGFSFVQAHLEIEFIKPAEYPADLLIGSGISSTGNTSITSFQTIYDSESKVLLSVAEASGVWFNLEKQRPARVPEFAEKHKFMLDHSMFE